MENIIEEFCKIILDDNFENEWPDYEDIEDGDEAARIQLLQTMIDSDYASILDWKAEMYELECCATAQLSNLSIDFDYYDFIDTYYPTGFQKDENGNHLSLEEYLMDLSSYLSKYDLGILAVDTNSDQYVFLITKLDTIDECDDLFNEIDDETEFSSYIIESTRPIKEKVEEVYEEVIKDADAINLEINREEPFIFKNPYEGYATVMNNTYNYIYFGEYPQEVVLDDTTINELNKLTSNNGYLELNNKKYVKLTTSLYPIGRRDPSPTFSNGCVIENNKEYYFEIQPIKWNILVNNPSELKVLSYDILDKSPYRQLEQGILTKEQHNSYEYSLLRENLNKFYSTAFNEKEKNMIIESQIDNSLNTCERNQSSSYNNTLDKVYALSFNECYLRKYGFVMDRFERCNLRFSKVSDYAIAKGCRKEDEVSGAWLPRSQYAYATSGQVNTNSSEVNGSGIRPAFNFDMKKVIVKK